MKLSGVDGLNEFIDLLSLTKSSSMARYYLSVTRLFAVPGFKRRLKKISTDLAVPLALTKSHTIDIILPFDKISWIAAIDGYVRVVKKWSTENKFKVRLLYTGQISARARKELKKKKVCLDRIALG